MARDVWEELGERADASWYLHPLVAEQKRQVHLSLVARWTEGLTPGRALKTDLFEEAFGADAFYVSAFPGGTWLAGMDTSEATARKAAQRYPEMRCVLVTDARKIGLRSGSIDIIVSNSTLDHFATAEDFREALNELARILRPGGRLILTLDNPDNPLYPVLRWMSRRGWAPFPLGYTPRPAELEVIIKELRLQILERDWLIHNPRIVSTAIFQILDRMLGRRGDALAGELLWAFSLLGRSRAKRWSACFYAYCLAKPTKAGRPEYEGY